MDLNPKMEMKLKSNLSLAKSQIYLHASSIRILVYRLSKSQLNIKQSCGNCKCWAFWIKCWASFIYDSVVTTIGFSKQSISKLIFYVGCELQLIIGLIPNLLLWSFGINLNLPNFTLLLSIIIAFDNFFVICFSVRR